VKTLTFYEQVGILIPGAVLLASIASLVPTTKDFLVGEGLSLGDFGLFLILSYAAGQGVGAVGNVWEILLWKPFGGMPSMWVTHDPPKLLNGEQVTALQKRVFERFGYEVPPLRGLPAKRFSPFFAQLYADVMATNPARMETFNGLYGLNRGLAGALVAVIIAVLILQPSHATRIIVGASALLLVFTFRMYRFGVRFATELYMSFLNTAQRQVAPTSN
jgi:hypothetical protein